MYRQILVEQYVSKTCFIQEGSTNIKKIVYKMTMITKKEEKYGTVWIKKRKENC